MKTPEYNIISYRFESTKLDSVKKEFKIIFFYRIIYYVGIKYIIAVFTAKLEKLRHNWL